MASDGLFDNLFDDEILEEVQNCIKEYEQSEDGNDDGVNNETDGKGSDSDSSTTIMTSTEIPQLISNALAIRARIVSEDPGNPSSPFQCRAMHEGMYYQVSFFFFFFFFYFVSFFYSRSVASWSVIMVEQEQKKGRNVGFEII